MAVQVLEYAVTTPAGTLSTGPQVTSLGFPPAQVDRIEVRVPPGPAGVLGFRIGSGGVQIIPYNDGGWVVTDDEVIGWDLTDQIESGAWQLISYNTGSLPHTVYVRFLLTPYGLTAGAAGSAGAAPLDAAALASTGAG